MKRAGLAAIGERGSSAPPILKSGVQAMPQAGLYLSHAAIAAVLDCSESVLRAARNLTRAKLASRLKRRGPGHRATLYALEDVIAWARAHAHLTDAQEAALRERARPFTKANEGFNHV